MKGMIILSLLSKIKELCTNRDTTLAGLERTLGFSNGSMVKWDKNSPSIDKVKSVADYFNVSIDYLLDRSEKTSVKQKEFTNAKEAMQFILKQPALMAFGGYDLNKMSDSEIIDFANELLRQFELISYKYKK